NLSFDIVQAFPRQMDLTNMKSELPADARSACEYYQSMFIVIAGKKVIHDHIKILSCHPQTASVCHGSFSRKSSTFRIFVPTFCKPLCAALLRRETWIARANGVPFAVPVTPGHIFEGRPAKGTPLARATF